MFETSKYLIAASLLFTLLVQPNVAVAQEAPQLKENQKSVALIDMRVDMMIKEAVAAGTEQKAIDEMKLEGPFKNVKATEIVRVFGAVSLPETLEQAAELMSGPPKDGLPFEFFVRIKFKDADSLKRMESELALESKTMTLSDGKEYLTDEGPLNGLIFAHQVDETMFEFGTQAYLMQPKRNFFTDRLKTAFAAAPKDSFRLVIDLETRRDFLEQATAMAKADLDPFSAAYLDLIGKTKSLVITSSMSSDNLLSMIAEANNDSDAGELTEGIDGLLGLAKIGFGQEYKRMDAMTSPEMKDPLVMVKGMVDSLAATQSGSTVEVYVKKPAGFAEKMAKLQKAAAANTQRLVQLNNFKQMALGVLNYESVNQRFPFENKTGSAVSWRAKILPYLELNSMFEKMDMDKGATEAPNSKFARGNA